MDQEINLKPKVDFTDLKQMEESLRRMDGLFKSMAHSAAKVHLNSGGGGGAGTGTASGGSGSAAVDAMSGLPGGANHAQAIRRGRGGGASSQGSMNSGQFLTDFQSIIEPILPQLDAIMASSAGGGKGGKSGAAQHIRQHMMHVQSIAQHPAGSMAESHALLQATQATGLSPEALSSAASQYRTTQPTTGSVIHSYLGAHQQAQKGAQGSALAKHASGALGTTMRAAGLGKLVDVMGSGAAMPLAAGALAVGVGANQVRKGWGTYTQQAPAFSALSRSIGNLGQSFDTLRNMVNKTGLGFAESLPTITQAVQTLAPYTGNLGNRGLRHMLTASQGLAYSYGMSPVAMNKAFGQAAQIGILGTNSTTGQMTASQFAGLIGNAVAAGGMQGRQGQVLSAMLNVSQTLAQQLGQAPNMNRVAGILTTLNQSGNPNLQGAAGARLVGSLNQGIQHPGLGSAGALATYQQLNPNGKLGYFQEQYLQSQGVNGVNPTTGKSNLSAILQYYQKMLPGGKVVMHHGMPTEQTATVGALFGSQMHLTQSQSLNVLKAFQGNSIRQENATQSLAHQVGPGTLSTLLHKGGMNVFAGIANATGVGGAHGLNAYASQITHTLHGHVSAQYYHLAHQYQALGHVHATSIHQAQGIQHQRALDLAHMKTALGTSMVHGPTLGNSIDNLNRTMNRATSEWAKVAKELTPLANAFAHLSLGSAKVLHKAAHNPLGFIGSGGGTSMLFNWMSSLFGGPTTKTSAFQMPTSTSTGQAGATLASFVQGNQQSTFLSAFRHMMGMGTTSSGGGGGSGPYTTASWSPGGSASTAQTSFLKKALPYAQQVSKNTGLPTNFLLTQWADETGWGQHMAGHNNLGNISANGHSINYQSMGAFVKADSQLFQGSRYNALRQAAHNGASTSTLDKILQQSGYATNPQYGSQLTTLLGQVQALLGKIEKNTRTPTRIPYSGGV